jgi:DNA-directed RNA polymerase specialized sigma24 family protein
MPETADNRDNCRITFHEAPATGAVRPDRPVPGPAAWQDVVALTIDLARAVEAAVRDGSLSGVESLALYLHYAQGWEMDRIAQRLGMRHGEARQALRRALKAIQQTGLLQGYEE